MRVRTLWAALCVVAWGADSKHAEVARARLLQDQGSLDEARSVYQKILPVFRAERDRDGLSRTLLGLAQIALARGQYEETVRDADESASLFHGLGDGKSEARALTNAGLAHLYAGQYQPALASFERALEIARRIGDTEGEVVRLNNIAYAYSFQGRYMEALQKYRQALNLLEQGRPQSWTAARKQLTVANLAVLYQQLGREDLALELYRQLRAAPQALPPEEQAQMLANVGALYRHLGDPVKAMETYRNAQALYAQTHHRDGEIGVLINAAIAQAVDLDDLPGAVAMFTKALALADESQNHPRAVGAHLYRAEALLRVGRIADAARDFQAALDGAGRVSDAGEKWKALYGLGRLAQPPEARRRYREAIAVIESDRSQLAASSLRSGFLADKRDVYDALIESLLDDPKPDVAEILRLMEQARARNLQDRVARGSSTVPEIASRLAPGTILVEYWIGSKSAAALWISRSGSGLARLPVSSSAIGELAGRVAALSSNWRGLASELGRDLLSGIPSASALVIVPDGALQLLPFEILVPPGSAELLVERTTVSYLPSADLLGTAPFGRGSVSSRTLSPPILSRDQRERLPRAWTPPWRRNLLAIGDPLPQANSGLLAGEEAWSRLPASAAEIRSIATLLRGRTELHTGADALKQYLLGGHARGVPLVHLSTHAFADSQDSDRSRIAFSSTDPSRRFDYLFFREIAAMDLTGVDLAVIAACDSERGVLLRGEGVQGFSRALLAAGAKSTVTALWSIDDQSTAEFMKQFYFRLASGESKANALREAKLKLLRSESRLADPLYWAGFVLNGDADTPIPHVIPWTAFWLPPVFFAALLFLWRGLRL